MLHTLGLFHEHQRPDRDNYIYVNMSALAKTGYASQFKKACFLIAQLQIQRFNSKSLQRSSIWLKSFEKTKKFNYPIDKSTPYDIHSIMHYDGYLRGRLVKPIMIDKRTQKGIGVNKQMSSLDIKKLNEMYPCDSTACGKFSGKQFQLKPQNYLLLHSNQLNQFRSSFMPGNAR